MAVVLTFVVFVVVVFLPSLVIVGFKLHWLSLVLTMLGFLVLGFASLGLPGALFSDLVEPVMVRLGKPAVPADSAWPTAIILTLVLPLALVPAWFVTRGFFTTSSFAARLFVFAGVFFVLSYLIGVVAYLILF